MGWKLCIVTIWDSDKNPSENTDLLEVRFEFTIEVNRVDDETTAFGKQYNFLRLLLHLVQKSQMVG